MSRQVVMIRIKGAWWIFFDLSEKGQDNLKKARGYLRTASDFYSAAVLLSDKGLYRPLLDTLNSATEPAVLAQLMISASQQFIDNNRKRYQTIEYIYSIHLEGSHPVVLQRNLYDTRDLRGPSRYMKSEFNLKPKKAIEHLRTKKR